MIDKKGLAALYDLCNRPLPPPEKGTYAELLDEEDPEGMVLIKRAGGELAMAMPRQVYEDIREMAAKDE